MPLFEYMCPGCGQSFEKLVRSSQPAQDEIECPQCGNTHAKRQISTFAVSGGGRSSVSSAPAPASGGL